MVLNKYQKGLTGYFVVLLVFWLILNFSIETTDGFYNYLFSFAFSLVPFVVGFFSLFLSKSWGGIKSSVGRSVFFLSLGSFCWGLGSMIWSYFNFFLSVSAPYPSIADLGFLLGSVFWSAGILSLTRATGARSGLRRAHGRVLLLLIPITITVLSYYLLVYVARGGVLSDSFEASLKLFFDLAYPLSDVVILTIALVIFSLSINYLGGKFKPTILILLLGFAVMYLADFTFSYTTTVGTFYNGGFGDLLFATALFLISYGTLGFNIQKE